MENIRFFFLLVVAMFIGWLLAKLGNRRSVQRKKRSADIYQNYFVGLNYLLNDEPDEAVDTFIRALEVNGDTVETYLALGALLRRRGKVDEAIRVHQTLLARPGLDGDIAESARLALALDFIAAGLLDRAERLLDEAISEDSGGKWEALKLLVTVYETEKEWESAIGAIDQLLANSNYKKDADLRTRGAHYCSELAEQQVGSDTDAARHQIKRAFTYDRRNVRASLLMARIEQEAGNFQSAARELLRIKNNHPDFTSEVVEQLADCYKAMDKHKAYEKLLMDIVKDNPGTSATLSLTQRIASNQNAGTAIDFLASQMAESPSLKGISCLLGLQAEQSEGEASQRLLMLKQALDKFLENKPGYLCGQCGFESRKLYWSCPSCQKWGSIRPIVGAEGE